MNEHDPHFPRSRDANEPASFVDEPPTHPATSWLRGLPLWNSRVVLLLLLVGLVLVGLFFSGEVIVDFWRWVVRQTALGS